MGRKLGQNLWLSSKLSDLASSLLLPTNHSSLNKVGTPHSQPKKTLANLTKVWLWVNNKSLWVMASTKHWNVDTNQVPIPTTLRAISINWTTEAKTLTFLSVRNNSVNYGLRLVSKGKDSLCPRLRRLAQVNTHKNKWSNHQPKRFRLWRNRGYSRRWGRKNC